MKSNIKEESDGSYTLSVNLKLEGSMLEMEEHIQQIVNSIGLEATMAALRKFETNGAPIEHKGNKLTSKGVQKKNPHALRNRRS